jgi:hypothetical protein
VRDGGVPRSARWAGTVGVFLHGTWGSIIPGTRGSRVKNSEMSAVKHSAGIPKRQNYAPEFSE